MSVSLSRSEVRIWAIGLIVFGLSIAAYKHVSLNFPLKPDQQTAVWTAQAQASFEGSRGPVKLAMPVPNQLPGFIKIDEDFISGSYGLSLDYHRGNRIANWALRRARGQQRLYYRISVAPNQQSEVNWGGPPVFPRAPDYPDHDRRYGGRSGLSGARVV